MVRRINEEDDSEGSAVTLRFIDLFAGIGDIRLALESTGAQYAFSSGRRPQLVPTRVDAMNQPRNESEGKLRANAREASDGPYWIELE